MFELKCMGCALCIQACPHNAIVITTDNKPVINRTKCTVCGACAAKCPAEALVINGKNTTVDALLHAILGDKSFYSHSGGGVTISGGEPLLQAYEISLLLKKCHTNGIHTAIDTAGNVSFNFFEQVLEHTDLFLFDLKIMC